MVHKQTMIRYMISTRTSTSLLPRRLEPIACVCSRHCDGGLGDVVVRLLQYCRRSTPRQCDGALSRASYPGATAVGEEVLFHAAISEALEVGELWTFG